jgi:uncharacterized damage-inducible protein DinB
VTSIHSMIDYEMWALERELDALEKSPAPRYKAQLIFAHILNAYRIWLDRIEGRPVGATPWDERSIGECRDALAAARRDYRRLAESLDEAGLDRAVAYQNTKGRAFATSVRDILLQALLHAAYHRGQVNMLIRQAGAEPAVIDYIAYVHSRGGTE